MTTLRMQQESKRKKKDQILNEQEAKVPEGRKLMEEIEIETKEEEEGT